MTNQNDINDGLINLSQALLERVEILEVKVDRLEKDLLSAIDLIEKLAKLIDEDMDNE